MADERAERETAVRIAASFYSGRDGIGPAKLFETAELIREYVDRGSRKIARRAATSPRR